MNVTPTLCEFLAPEMFEAAEKKAREGVARSDLSGGIDLLADEIAKIAEYRSRMMYANWAAAIESPIPRLLFVGIVAGVEQEVTLHFVDMVLSDGCRALTEYQVAAASKPGTLLIQYQYKLLSWRADFVLSAPSYSGRKIIVECDHSNAHERTKEQVAKARSCDRAATAAGHRILRFNGSEIQRAPMDCVKQLLKQARWLAGEDE